MNAKLYRVTVTQLFPPFRAEVAQWWIAANSAQQARKKALDTTYLTAPLDRVHVRAENYSGGAACIRHVTLKEQTT